MIQLFIAFFLNILVSPVKAIEVTPTPDPKVEQFVEGTLKPSIAKSNPSISEPVSDKPKSFFGIINQIDDQQILITSQNKNLTLQLNDKITYIDIKRQKSKLTNFKVGQTILAMGYLNQDGILDCRRLIATDSKSVENSYQVITGKIVDVSQSQSSPIFVLIPFQNKNGQYQIKIDSKTEISDINQKEINSSDIIVNGKKIIVVIKSETQNSQTFYASRIISLETNSQLSDSTLKQP